MKAPYLIPNDPECCEGFAIIQLRATFDGHVWYQCERCGATFRDDQMRSFFGGEKE